MSGRPMRFRLWGINNQNFLMRDDATGSWWQQVSGEAIQGRLRGKKLRQVPHDELSFRLWKRDHPDGRVLRPDPSAAGEYAKADWEDRIRRLPLVTKAGPDDPFEPRDVVHGIARGELARAYSADALSAGEVVQDLLGDLPLVIVVAEDGRSVRAFDRRVDGRALELAPAPEGGGTMRDAETGSTWTFAGRATAGPLAGRSLARVELLTDFWFDWKLYHPRTTAWGGRTR